MAIGPMSTMVVSASGRFSNEPTEKEEQHPVAGCFYTFGFDDRPFAKVLQDRTRHGELIAAVREEEEFSAHVAGLDK
jgi:hypothetical protein